jgi:hypothetical protein
LIVEYQTKKSLHFSEDFEIFCEGEWEQSQQLTRIFDNNSNAPISQRLVGLGQTGLVGLVGHIGSDNHNGSVDCNGHVYQNNLDYHVGLVDLSNFENPYSRSSKFIVASNSEGEISKAELECFGINGQISLTKLIVTSMFGRSNQSLLNDDFQLVVKLIPNLTFEGAQAPSSKLIVGCGYSEISFHFCKDCRIFREGVKDSTIDIVSNNGIVGHISLVGLGGFSGISGLVGRISLNAHIRRNGLIVRISDLVGHNGLVGRIVQNGLNGFIDLGVSFISLGLVGFIGLSASLASPGLSATSASSASVV